MINTITVFELTKVDNNGINLRIGIPLLFVKIIEQIPNSDTCKINDHEVNLTFDEAVQKINSFYKVL